MVGQLGSSGLQKLLCNQAWQQGQEKRDRGLKSKVHRRIIQRAPIKALGISPTLGNPFLEAWLNSSIQQIFMEHLLYTDCVRYWGHSGEYNGMHVHVLFSIHPQEESSSLATAHVSFISHWLQPWPLS